MNHEQENKEVVIVNNDQNSLADTTDDIIASAERRIANLQKVITLALKITNDNDWVDFQGKPYLQSSGAQKVARLFGVCWREMKTEKIRSEDEKGSFYFYKTTALFYLNGKNDLVEATGTCSQKDKFFSSAGGQTKPVSEIDETNIMKSAITNCISNGVTSLLGLKNLTWDQVRSGGIDKVSKVNYASGGSGGGVISEAQGKRLFAMSKEFGKTPDQVKEYIGSLGYESSKDIKKSDYEKICNWIEGK